MKELNVEGLNKTFGIDGPSVITLNESDYEVIQEPDTWFTKLPRCKWKTKRYWWNNGVEQTLQEKCPPGWKRGRLLENRKTFKAKVGSGCGQRPHNFIVTYADGREETINGLKPWCKNNNYSYTAILYLRRELQPYHKDIVKVEKLNNTQDQEVR